MQLRSRSKHRTKQDLDIAYWMTGLDLNAT